MNDGIDFTEGDEEGCCNMGVKVLDKGDSVGSNFLRPMMMIGMFLMFRLPW